MVMSVDKRIELITRNLQEIIGEKELYKKLKSKKELIGDPTIEMLILILSIVLISGIISYFLTIFLAEFFSIHMGKVNYTYLSLGTLFILITLVFLLSGFLGLAVLIASTFTGIYCINLNVRRTNMMGCLLLPTIIFYLFL